MAWYDNAIIFYDWIRYGEDLDTSYAEFLVKKAKDICANTLAFCSCVGGYAIWDSKVSPKYQRIGQMDLVGELAKLCEENNLYFVPWWLGTSMGVARVLYEHPDWAYLGPPIGDKAGKRWHYVCYNSPYRDIIYNEVREVLANYKVDGVYFDQLPGSCYCPSCQEKFEKTYNEPMPIVEAEEVVPLLHKAPPAGFPPKLREFRRSCIIEFCKGIREIIDETQPGVCYAQNWIHDHKSRFGKGIVDVVLPEFYQKNDLVPLGMKHRITRAYFGGTIWGNVRHSVKHDGRHFPVRGTKMILADCAANYASPLMLDLCALDFDYTPIGELAETFKDIAEIQKLQDGAEPIRYAAILHSLDSYEHDPENYLEGFEGIYRLLFEAHIPFEIVTEQDIQDGKLKDYNVLVIADAAYLQEKTANVIKGAVEKGVGLIATYKTSLQTTLADILGIELKEVVELPLAEEAAFDKVLGIPDIDSNIFYFARARTEHQLAEGIAKESLFSFEGGFAIVELVGTAEVIADICENDEQRLKQSPYNRRGIFPKGPKWPLAVVNKKGKGKTAYFAAQADSQKRRLNAPELDRLMLNVILWAGGNVPLETPDVPASVEVRPFHNEKQKLYNILLINQMTNSLMSISPAPGVVRYVTSQKQLELILHTDRKIKGVKSLKNADVELGRKNGAVGIKLSVLDLYDCISLEYE